MVQPGSGARTSMWLLCCCGAGGDEAVMLDLVRRVIPTGYTSNIRYFCYGVHYNFKTIDPRHFT